jgi:hypothetical protein
MVSGDRSPTGRLPIFPAVPVMRGRCLSKLHDYASRAVKLPGRLRASFAEKLAIRNGPCRAKAQSEQLDCGDRFA